MFLILARQSLNTDEQKLIKFLMDNYTKSSRPVENSSESVQVEVQIEVIRIDNVVSVLLSFAIIFFKFADTCYEQIINKTI